MNKKTKRTFPLFVKLLLIVPLITIIFWIISTLIALHYLKDNIQHEFTNSNTRMIKSIGNQIIRDIRFADYINIRRLLVEYYDPKYMSYLAVYTDSMNPLGISPPQLSGKNFLLMEDKIRKFSKTELATDFFKLNGNERFHFQYQIKDSSGQLLGFIAVGGTTKHLSSILSEQKLSFSVFGLLVLALQIGAIIFFVNRFTKPLSNLTGVLKKAGKFEPNKIIPTLIKQEPKYQASSEVHVFYKTYKRLLQEIQKHQENAKIMAVQAAIGKVASHIAHDMRSPLSVINAALNQNLTKDTDKKLLIDTGIKSATKLDRMADDLLEYAKARHIEKKAANITKIIDDVQREIQEIAKPEGKTITIEVEGDQNIIANVDPHRLNRVLVNLMTNSVQAIKHKSGKIKIKVGAKGKDLKIKVKDNGEGISEKHLERLFDSSFTFGKSGGSGLGLSYCKNVVEAHGGKIGAKSSKGEGSTFTISIPKVITSARPTKETAEANHTHKKVDSKKRILVMDDEEELMITWRIKLKEATGRKPTEIDRPEKLLESNIDGNTIDIAIIDYEFRGSDLNGIDVIEHLKRKGIKDLYLCTAYYKDRDIQKKAAKLGIKKIIPKPIPEDILQEIL